MQSEDFDNRVRDAADNHHPAYDEKAWAKMESLLDTHMPVEKDRKRRFIFLLLLFAFFGGMGWMVFRSTSNTPVAQVVHRQQTTNGKAEPKNAENVHAQPAGLSSQSKEATELPANQLSATTPMQQSNMPSPGGNKGVPKETGIDSHPSIETDPTIRLKSPAKSRKIKSPGQAKSMLQVQQTRRTLRISDEPGDRIALPMKSTIDEYAQVNSQSPATVVPVSPPMDTVIAIATVEAQPKIDSIDKRLNIEVKKKGSKKLIENGFAITIAAGPDVSAIGSKVGKLRAVVGAGVAYTFVNRFTIRTGVYGVSKVYTAKPGDYKFPNIIPNVSHLQEIDANCRVMEIPLSLAYNFGTAKHRNWFASAGLSSYIMKREKYDYVYNYQGSVVRYASAYKNENRHILSVLSLSAGYKRQLSDKFSMSAEPYLQLPLDGIGVGEVNLKSAGLLFSIGVKF